jgi:hypothetical protein
MGLLDTLLGAPGSDQSQAMGLLAAGLMQGNMAGGLLAANNIFSPDAKLARAIKQAQLANYASEAAQREQQTAALKQEAERQAGIRQGLPQLMRQPGMTGGQAVPQTMGGVPMFGQPMGAAPMQQQPGGFDVQRAMTEFRMQPKEVEAYVNAMNAGRPEVARTIKSLDANGREVETQYDKFGNKIGGDLTQYRAPISVNRGNSNDFLDPYTLQPKASFKTFQSPDSAASNATSRANNADTIRAENMRSGFNPDGSATGDMETTARAIASGQLPPPSGMALTSPRNQRLLARVMELNPKYDFTDITAKKKAASDFTSGSQGNALRSFSVAGQHLDQLGQLVDAMNNGNTQLVNKIGNIYSQQTGNPAVTNFDAAKDVVSKEVVKAIVAGGGGVSEREELSKLMDSAKSPAQLKGVIAQYRNLMAAQHEALLQQRRAAGLRDETLPNYNDANGSSSPDGWTYLGVKK